MLRSRFYTCIGYAAVKLTITDLEKNAAFNYIFIIEKQLNGKLFSAFLDPAKQQYAKLL